MYVSISVQIKFTCRFMYKVQRNPICFVVFFFELWSIQQSIAREPKDTLGMKNNVCTFIYNASWRNCVQLISMRIYSAILSPRKSSINVSFHFHFQMIVIHKIKRNQFFFIFTWLSFYPWPTVKSTTSVMKKTIKVGAHKVSNNEIQKS